MMQTNQQKENNTFTPTCHTVGDNHGPAAVASVIPPAFLIDQDGKKHYRSACKARGVADDHNAQTAYILTPEDAVHGHILSCSHPKCNATGRLFRYCAVCRQAVTKRNFHRRHNHGLIEYDEEKRPILPEEEEIPSTLTTANPPVVGTSRPFSEEAATTPGFSEMQPLAKRPRTLAFQNDFVGLGNNNNQGIIARRQRIDPISDDDDEPRISYRWNNQPSYCNRSLSQAESNWLKLFHHRPTGSSSDPVSMSKWCSSVMNSVHVKDNSQATTTGPTVGQPLFAEKGGRSSNLDTRQKKEDDKLGALDVLELADLDSLLSGSHAFVGSPPPLGEKWNLSY